MNDAKPMPLVGTHIDVTIRGGLAIVTTEDAVVVAPVGKAPDVATGSTVNLERTTGRNATVASVAGKSLDQQTGRAIDGLEAGR